MRKLEVVLLNSIVTQGSIRVTELSLTQTLGSKSKRIVCAIKLRRWNSFAYF